MRPPALLREALDVEKLADLAQGGMGSVEIGVVRTGRLAGRPLAIKRLHDELARDPDVVSMFMDEAWLTSQIESPHVVKVEAFGEDDRGIFLATELVRGVSLGRLVSETRARGEPFAERTVAFIGSQVCHGLTAAHELRDTEGAPLGLVHRDLTPGNVLIAFDGLVKIADFGIAKAERRVSATTRMGVLKGKPSYVSPEQVRGGAIDGRADIFALGIVLFELLAGRRPWRGKDDTDVLIAMMRTEPPRLADLRPNISPTLGALVDSCLRKRPEERPQSAEEVRAVLDAFRAERGFAADDPSSLAAFVDRNTAELAGWFEQALAGALSNGGQSLQQAADDLDRTRVHVQAPTAQVLQETMSDKATATFQHQTPPPGAAAMAAALSGGRASTALLPETLDQMPESAPTMALHGAAAARLAAAAEQARRRGSSAESDGVEGSAALSRLAAATPPRLGPQTMPLGPVGSAGNPSSSKRSPAATEWLAAPPSSPRGSSSGYGEPPASTEAPSSIPRYPSAPEIAARSPQALARAAPRSGPAGGGGGLRVFVVFTLVFLTTVAVVGLLLRSGIVQLD